MVDTYGPPPSPIILPFCMTINPNWELVRTHEHRSQPVYTLSIAQFNANVAYSAGHDRSIIKFDVKTGAILCMKENAHNYYA